MRSGGRSFPRRPTREAGQKEAKQKRKSAHEFCICARRDEPRHEAAFAARRSCLCGRCREQARGGASLRPRPPHLDLRGDALGHGDLLGRKVAVVDGRGVHTLVDAPSALVLRPGKRGGVVIHLAPVSARAGRVGKNKFHERGGGEVRADGKTRFDGGNSARVDKQSSGLHIQVTMADGRGLPIFAHVVVPALANRQRGNRQAKKSIR